MEGWLTFTVDGVERRIFFGNYALEMTLAHFEVSVTDVMELLQKNLLGALRVFIYHAAAYPILKEGNEPDFKAFDVHEWIDKTGGASGTLVVPASKELYRALGLTETTEEQPAKKKKPQK